MLQFPEQLPTATKHSKDAKGTVEKRRQKESFEALSSAWLKEEKGDAQVQRCPRVGKTPVLGWISFQGHFQPLIVCDSVKNLVGISNMSAVARDAYTHSQSKTIPLGSPWLGSILQGRAELYRVGKPRVVPPYLVS